MGKALVFIIIVILAGVGFWLYQQGNDSGDTASEDMPEMSESPSVPPTPTATFSPDTSPNASITPSEPVSEVKTFVVTGQPFSFTPNEITVNKGDTVRIVFKNLSGNHNWTIDEFNARTKVIKTGEEDTIEFIADKAGTFQYYCSVGTHRQMGMRGEFIVK